MAKAVRTSSAEVYEINPGALTSAAVAIQRMDDCANEAHFLRGTLTRDDLPGLPAAYRLVTLEREVVSERECRMTAVLFHASASLRVTWTARQPDTRLKSGQLVQIRWVGGAPCSDSGAILISRLVLVERHLSSVNLFETVPSEWVADRMLLERGSALWRTLLPPFQELINAIFWEGERFERFCRAPSSCKGHHSEAGGNLRHAVETAEAVASLLPKFCSAHPSLALTAALLHDAGKSDDYVMAPGQVNRLSDWGRLVSHKPTVTFWIGEIHLSLKNRLSRAMLQSLLHAINATKAPPELGLRKPMTPEAILLSLADLASGKGDLFGRQSARDGGWGMPHPHLGEQGPYTVAGWEVD